MTDLERADPGSELDARERPPAARGAAWRSTAAALLVFLAADALLFQQFFGRDLSRDSVLPSADINAAFGGSEDRQTASHSDAIWQNDLRFVTWQVSRNARTLFTHPSQLFDAEPCYPAARSLALGEPGISQGALAAPLYFATRDPIVTLNALLFMLPILSGLAMFLLVRAWSGSPAAGIAAGLLYGFHPIKTWDAVHPYVWDTAPTVLALFFAVRLFSDRRWRDAFGLAACISLQIAGSFYALLSAMAIAIPFLVWLCWTYGVSRGLLLRVGLAAAGALCVAALVMTPYLEFRGAGVLTARESYFFVSPRWLMPGAFLFPGWLLIGLAAIGLLSPRDRCLRVGDLRWAVAAACAGLLLLSTAYSADPGRAEAAPSFHLYSWLASIVPGLDVIRSPASLYSGTHLTLCILAGLGCAALLAATSGRLRGALGSTAILACAASVLSQGFLAPDTFGYRFVSVHPDPDAIRFFERLAQLGNTGPLLEVPIPPSPEAPRVTRSILLSEYHRRQTSECRNSFMPPELEDARRAAKALPSLAGAREARELGFTTVVLHHPTRSRFARGMRKRFEQFVARHPSGPLIPLIANDSMSAYAIDPGAGAPR